MAKSLKTLARQLRRNHGVTLVPTFDGRIRPGSLLTVKRAVDIDHIGHLTDDPAIAAEALEVEGPAPSLLVDLRRTHELQVGSALDLLQPTGRARASLKRAKEVVVSFDSPVSYRVSLIQLESLIESDPGIWQRPLGQQLRQRRNRVVFQVIRGRLSLLFRGSGTSGIHLRTGLADLEPLRLGQRWQWRNEATLESKEEVVLAVETARYQRKRERFVSI